MQLIIEARGENADRLSFFFGKHPERPFTKETKYGEVEFKFLTYEPQFAKAYLCFKPNGLSLVRESSFKQLEHYINDREFALSTIFFTSVRHCIGYVFSGNEEGIENHYDFKLLLSPLSTRLPNSAILELFEPLGYEVEIERMGNIINLTLQKTTDIGSIFKHIYTLIPVLDNYKHYYILGDDVEKLIRYGDGWLENHPKREWITKRFVGYKENLFQEALTRFDSLDDRDVTANTSLAKLRYSAFADVIKDYRFTEVVDMGAGEGNLLELLIQNKNLSSIFACEPTQSGLLKMKKKVEIWAKSGLTFVQPDIIQSSLFYVDDRLIGKQCLALCEVIEHIDADRIDSVLDILLGKYAPGTLLISTPNIEYNPVYHIDGFRHRDHRFEMTRQEFQNFITKHADKAGYEASFLGIGDLHLDYGQPTQMAVITKK